MRASTVLGVVGAGRHRPGAEELDGPAAVPAAAHDHPAHPRDGHRHRPHERMAPARSSSERAAAHRRRRRRRRGADEALPARRHGAGRGRFAVAARRVRGGARPERRGQDDALPLPHRADPTRSRLGPHRRARHRGAAGARYSSGAARGGADLPAVQPDPAADRDRERAGRPPGPRADVAGAGAALHAGRSSAGARLPRHRRAPRQAPARAPTSSPAASSSAWPSRARWPSTPRSSWPTSRWPASTPSLRPPCWSRCARPSPTGVAVVASLHQVHLARTYADRDHGAARRTHGRGHARRRGSTRARSSRSTSARWERTARERRARRLRVAADAEWNAGDLGCGELVLELRWPDAGAGARGSAAADRARPGRAGRHSGLVPHDRTRRWFRRASSGVPHPTKGALSHGQQILRQPHPRQGQHRQGDGRLRGRQRRRRLGQGDARVPQRRGRAPRPEGLRRRHPRGGLRARCAS